MPLIDIDALESTVEEFISLDRVELSLRELDTGWPWPLDAVQKFFETLYNSIVNVPARVWDFFYDKFKGVIEWFWGNIAWPLVRFAWDVYSLTYEWTSGWSEPWATIARFFLFPAAFTYKALRDVIIPRFTALLSDVKKYFDGAVGGIFDAIRNAFSPIFDPLKRFADVVYDFFTKTVPDFIKSAVDFFAALPRHVLDFFNFIREKFFAAISSIVDFFTKTVPEWAGKAWDFISKIPDTLRKLVLEDLPKAVLSGISLVVEFFNEKIISPVREAVVNVFTAIADAIRGFLRGVVDYFTSIPDDYARGGFEAVLVKLLPLIGAGFGIAVAVDLAGLKIAGSGIDPDAVRNFISNTVFKFFDISIFTSVFFAIAVQKPLEYVVKRAFRTSRPSPEDALKFLSKNIISRGEALEYLQISGYPDRIAEHYLKSIFREPDFTSIFTAYRRGKISEQEYGVWLRVLNIDRAETLDGVLYPFRILEEASYKVPSPFIIVAAIESGEVSEETLYKILTYDLIHPELVDETVKGLLWRSLREERSLLRRYVIDLFSEGAMNIVEFDHWLGVLGVSEKLSKSIVEVAVLHREKTVRKRVFSQLEKMFLEGYISRAEFIEKASSLTHDAELIVKYAALLEYIRDNYYVVRETRDERSAYKATLVSKFKRGYISEEELLNELLKLNLNEIEIELTLARARQEYDAEQKEILFKDLIEKLKTGLMTKTMFTDECTRLGIKYEKCLSYADYYWSKYIGEEFYVITRDERNALASIYIKKYVMGFMSEEELRSKLRRLMFTDQEIDLRVERAIEEDELKILTDLLAEADALLKKREITIEEYIEHLVSLGMRREKAETRARRILAAARKT